jgi:hypothetical protein
MIVWAFLARLVFIHIADGAGRAIKIRKHEIMPERIRMAALGQPVVVA